MTRVSRNLILLFALLGASHLFAADVPKVGDAVEIQGFLEAVQYDGDGVPTRLAIWQGRTRAFELSPEGKGLELLKLAGSEVKISGRVVPLGDKGDTMVEVVAYEVLYKAEEGD